MDSKPLKPANGSVELCAIFCVKNGVNENLKKVLIKESFDSIDIIKYVIHTCICEFRAINSLRLNIL